MGVGVVEGGDRDMGEGFDHHQDFASQNESAAELGVDKPKEQEPLKRIAETRTRVRRPPAGAHRGPAQFVPGFRYAPPGATFRRPFGS
jgi:hypothetical protein